MTCQFSTSYLDVSARVSTVVLSSDGVAAVWALNPAISAVLSSAIVVFIIVVIPLLSLLSRQETKKAAEGLPFLSLAAVAFMSS